jgi:allantoin racemase
VPDAVLAAAASAARQDTRLVAVTGDFGPLVIGSRAENAIAQLGVLDLVARNAAGCDAVVLGVSLDTALWACRELVDIPVIGMTEAGLMVGCTLAPRIGLLTYGRRMAPLYRELAQSYGLATRLAGVEALDVTPQQTFDEPEAVRASVLAGIRLLVERDGAEAVLLAGAAMASLASQLQAEVDVPLLDGVACAVAMAEARVALRLPKARVGSTSPIGTRDVTGISPALAALFSGPG